MQGDQNQDTHSNTEPKLFSWIFKSPSCMTLVFLLSFISFYVPTHDMFSSQIQTFLCSKHSPHLLNFSGFYRIFLSLEWAFWSLKFFLASSISSSVFFRNLSLSLLKHKLLEGRIHVHMTYFIASNGVA